MNSGIVDAGTDPGVRFIKENLRLRSKYKLCGLLSNLHYFFKLVSICLKRIYKYIMVAIFKNH
jgi:hypothetical protein